VIWKHHIPASWRHLSAFVLFLAACPAVALLLWLSGFAAAAQLVFGVWLLGAASYVCACIAAALWTARKAGFRLLPVLPVVFACYHLSYGALLILLIGLLADGVALRLGRMHQNVTGVPMADELTESEPERSKIVQIGR
jgi:hypothetical protein